VSGPEPSASAAAGGRDQEEDVEESQVANPWLGRRPFHWAHQGGAKEAPSNTLYAMEEGRRNGAHGLEFDVHRSRDGQIVLIHDHTLDRTTNRSGWVAQHSAGELAGFDAAYWWVPGEVDNHEETTAEAKYELRGRVDKDPDLGIPTLDEVLDRFGHLPMTIEVKDERAVDGLLKTLRDKAIPMENLIVTAFNGKIVGQLHAKAPDLPLAPALPWTLGFLIRARLHLPLPKRGPYVALQVPHRRAWKDIIPGRVGALIPGALKLTVVTRRFVRAAHRAGLAVHVWTIDDEDEMRQLLVRKGVDGIMTDRPSVLTQALAEN
jgi:glycerophosphoryl diester phosphodiesterase